MDLNMKLSNENKRLKECIKVMIEYKNFVDSVINKLNSFLDSNDSQKYKEINNKVEDIFKTNNIISVSNNSFNHLNSNVNKIKNVTQNTTINKVIPTEEVTQPLSQQITKEVPKEVRFNLGNKSFYVVPQNQIQSTNETSNKGFVCNIDNCRQVFETQIQLKLHKNRSHFNELKYICEYPDCLFKTWTKSGLKLHQMRHSTHKQIRFTSKRVIPRIKSSEKMKDFSNTNNTINVSNNDSNQPKLNKNERQDESQSMWTNGLTQARQAWLKVGNTLVWGTIIPKNQIKSNENNIFICGINNCNKMFINEIRLNSHKKLSHGLEMVYNCEHTDCHFKCGSRNGLDRHMNSHSSERPFSCEFEGCFAKFKTRYALKEHKLIHSNEDTFKCSHEGCSQSFKTKKRLLYHILDHTNERKFVCPWQITDMTSSGESATAKCGKKFKLSYQLKVHMKTHKNTKRYMSGVEPQTIDGSLMVTTVGSGVTPNLPQIITID